MTNKKYSKKNKIKGKNKTNKKFKKTHLKGSGKQDDKNKNKNKLKHNHTLKSTPIELSKVNCSPKDKKEIKNYTCYTDKSLFKLRDKWNIRHPYEKITTNDTKEIHKILSNYLSDLCNK